MSAKTICILLWALALTLVTGCSQESSSAPASASADNAQAAAAPEKSGAELWAENCSRCHNYRPPQSFSEAQWHAVVHHMRFRANLTGREARITAFLQASNQQ